MEMFKKNADGSVTISGDFTWHVTLGKRSGNIHVLPCKVADFPANAIESIFTYGGQRKFNDKVGGADSEVEDKIAEAEAMIERFKEGIVGRVSAAGVDAFTHECRLAASRALRKTAKEVWAKLKDLNADERNERLDAIVAKNPSLQDEARAEMARKQDEAKRRVVLDLDAVDL